ncbi:response regulator transcription factor [Nonomuraea sp. NPDC049309]|uniref:response regulator transcription factor n=1 Tax=Nonomuraea sp. NPDC049309 TaxID=3364350 RepID=UPI0037110328
MREDRVLAAIAGLGLTAGLLATASAPAGAQAAQAARPVQAAQTGQAGTASEAAAPKKQRPPKGARAVVQVSPNPTTKRGQEVTITGHCGGGKGLKAVLAGLDRKHPVLRNIRIVKDDPKGFVAKATLDRKIGNGVGPVALTSRELEAVRLVALGLCNTEIAERLVISPLTAKTHITRAIAKLGVRDRVQLVILAYESGLVRPGT